MDRYIPIRNRTSNRRRTRSPELDAQHPSATDKTTSHSRRDLSLPKNFNKPLTCFFWHQYGRCNKRDVDCAYAHWDTGFLAAGPIHLPGSKRSLLLIHQKTPALAQRPNQSKASDSIAGKNAQTFTSLSSQDESGFAMKLVEIKEREYMLRLRELDVREKEKSIARREQDLAQSIRHRNKELGLREKRVARMEEASRSAGEGKAGGI